MRIVAKNLIAVNAHIGLQKFNWQPENERFAIGYRNSTIIYNLTNTNFYLNKAVKFIETLISKFGRVYIYGLKSKHDGKIITQFYRINQVVSITNWRGGSLTNFRNFKKSNKNSGKKFSAVISLVHEYQNYSISRESFVIGLPVVSPVDSNARPENFTYPIPINSSSLGTKKFLAYMFALAVFRGISRRLLTRIRVRRSKKRGRKKRLTQRKRQRLKKNRDFRLYKIRKSRIRLKKWEKVYKWFKQVTRVKNDYTLTRYDRDVALYAIGYSDIKPRRPFNPSKGQKTWYIKKIRIVKIKKPKATTSVTPKRKKKIKKKNKKDILKKKLKRRAKRLNQSRRISITNPYKRRPNFKIVRSRFRGFKKMKKFRRLRLKYSNIRASLFFTKIKLKIKRPSYMFKIIRLIIKMKKYTLIYKYLAQRKKKIILLRRLKKKRAHDRKKKTIKKLKLGKTRTYYHNFTIVKKPRKRKPYHTRIF